MNSLDLTLLLIMTVTVGLSTFRGGVREIFSLASVIIGFILASRYYQMDTFLRLTQHDWLNNTITFFAIFMITSVLISFIGGRISNMVDKSAIKSWNTILGTMVGSLKGIVICSLLAYVLMVFLPADSPVLTTSKSLPYLSQASRILSPIGPEFFRSEFGKKLEALKKSAIPAIPAQPSGKPAPEPKK
ncbi:MAG TPA: CvpA family protein [Nitrospirota bacterium]|jgi:membrane protein required for colicin V production